MCLSRLELVHPLSANIVLVSQNGFALPGPSSLGPTTSGCLAHSGTLARCPGRGRISPYAFLL